MLDHNLLIKRSFNHNRSTLKLKISTNKKWNGSESFGFNNIVIKTCNYKIGHCTRKKAKSTIKDSCKSKDCSAKGWDSNRRVKIS